MKILNVGNFDIKNAQRTFFHTSRKLTHGFVRLGHSVVDFSDRDVARMFSLFNSRKLGVRAANSELLKTFRNIEPDLVLFGHADVIQIDTLHELRRINRDVKIVQWNYDALYLPDNIRRLSSKIDAVDMTFVSTAGQPMASLAGPGRRIAFLPNPVDQSMERGRSFERARHDHDLFFGMRNGSNYRRLDGRKMTGDEVAQLLRSRLPDLQMCLPGLEGGKPVYGMDYVKCIDSSLMGLSLSQESDQPLYASDRMAHLTANGTLTFVDRASGFPDLYGEDELAFYGSTDEMIDKLRHFKRNPDEARRIAHKGWQRTHAMFDSTRVARYLLEQTFRQPLSEGYEWPTECR